MKVLPETVPILGFPSQSKGSQMNNNSISLELTWSHKDNINKKKTANRLQVTTGCPDDDDDQEKSKFITHSFHEFLNIMVWDLCLRKILVIILVIILVMIMSIHRKNILSSERILIFRSDS